MKIAVSSFINFAMRLVALPSKGQVSLPHPLKPGWTCGWLWSVNRGEQTEMRKASCSPLMRPSACLWSRCPWGGTTCRETWPMASVHLQPCPQARRGPLGPRWLHYMRDPRRNPKKNCQLSPLQKPLDCEWRKFCCFESLSLCGLYVAMDNRCSENQAYPD